MSVVVTVAPGCHFHIVPHPSGIAGLRPLVVHGGERARVSQLRADNLWKARLIMHPVTGQPPPSYVADDQRVTLEGSGSGPVEIWDGLNRLSSSAVPQEQRLPETSASDRTRVARQRVAIGRDFPRALVDVTFEDALKDPVQVNQQAGSLPWPIEN